MSPIMQRKRDLRVAADLTREDIDAILERSLAMKAALAAGAGVPAPPVAGIGAAASAGAATSAGHPACLVGRSLAMIFEKPSLRTRCTFEIGMFQLGGHAVYLTPAEIGIGKRESIHDIARNLERWFDLVIARTFAQATVDGLARYCRIPVINALSDEEHPCQAMADVLTLREKVGDLTGFNLTYIGDGNNICHSLMIIGARLGMNVTVSSPAGFEPAAAVVRRAAADAARHRGSYHFCETPRAAVARAQAVYTDVWASMGQEAEAEARARLFAPWQVNAALMAAAPAGAFIMHDLPAHRGEEITDEMMDHPNSIVFDQAENRLHAQKGILVHLWEACG